MAQTVATGLMGHYRELIRPMVAVSLIALMGSPFLASPAFAEASTSAKATADGTADKPTAAVEPQASSQRANPETPAHWPRFRGPDSNPVSDNPNLPVTWSRTENVEWVADVPGVGWSSPVVWGTRVFLTAATSDQRMKPPSLGTEFSNDYIAELRKQGLSGDEITKRLWARDREMPQDIVISLMLFCYDLESGKRLWERRIYHGNPRGGRHVKNSFASETPVTDGNRVYAYFTDYGLYAFDFDGKPVWATPFERRETIRDYGTGASPALYRDRVFVLNDNEEHSFLAAFDARTGNELWRTHRTVTPARKTGWSTPFVWENRLRTEVVALGPGVAISYGLDGRELWRINRMGAVAIQSPFAWNDILFMTSGTSGDDNKPIVAIRQRARSPLQRRCGDRVDRSAEPDAWPRGRVAVAGLWLVDVRDLRRVLLPRPGDCGGGRWRQRCRGSNVPHQVRVQGHDDPPARHPSGIEDHAGPGAQQPEDRDHVEHGRRRSRG